MENNVDYRAKAIAFQGGLPTILCRKDDSSCPLLALCNSLILLGKFSFNVPPGATITEDEIIKLLCDHYMKKAPQKGKGTKKFATKTLRRLARPLDCNMKLTSVELETSEELQLFELLGIKVYHCNVVDPKEEQLIRAIGTDSYRTLLAGLATHNSSKHEHSSSPGSSNWELVDGFFKKNSSQLTAYGLKSLKQHMKDKNSTVCAMFWNHDFHVVFQLHGTLLVLQNGPDHFDTSVVWRHLDVNGLGFFMDRKFLPPQSALGATEHQMEKNVYFAKSFQFRGGQKFIICPSNMTGSSALLALCNAILLRGDVDLSEVFDCNKSLNLPHLHEIVSRGKKLTFYAMKPEEWVIAAGRLHQPVNVYMNFKNIYNIKIKNLKVFENFGFGLCHGFIANPEDLDLRNAVGSKYYDVMTKSPTSNLEAEGKLVEEFVRGYDTELTPYGLQNLIEEMSETDIYVIFWKKQFHIAIKRNNRICILDTNLRSFDEGKIWRPLDNVDDARASLAGIPYPISGKSGEKEHMCTMEKCLLTFTSSFNLQRHNSVHSTSSISNDLDVLKHRDEYSSCWDNLSSEAARDILSLKGMKFKEEIEGSLILRIIRQRSSSGDNVALKLSSIMSLSEENDKIKSENLFAILDEASEKTFLCSDIRNCKDEKIWDGSTTDIITKMYNLLACYSYVFEKAL